MKRWLVTVVLLGLGLAQSYKMLYSDEIERVPATVEVVQGFNTVISAHDYVELGTLGRPELVTITRLSKNVIQLNTSATSGVSGLTLLIGGRPQQFTVRIGGGLYNRTYIIQASRLAGYLPTGAPETGGGRSPSVPADAGTPSGNDPQGRAGPAGQKEAPGGGAKPSADRADVPTPAAGMGAREEWVLARVSGAQTLAGGGVFVINYSLENLSPRRVAADVARLVIRQAGREKSFSLSRLPASAILEPKAVQAGSILVKDVAPGELELEWTLVELGESPRTFVVRRTLNAAALSTGG
ncbi:hypothetical protein [Calidithermus roseus]|uniref:Uncharacterized protein n=1 Tax=Calidithermus roseus TaxID=1644118 RepID=A0A399EE63_9DEIN|nr:hypothetical protein [Calidithermus roseus]RIH82917.1 hypothetical protein Mrose_03235 [Calidithermus roseus]